MRFLAVPLLAGMLLVGGCGQETVRTADDAARAIGKILNGADPADFKLADDATRSAVVILDDAPEVGRLESALATAGDTGCNAATIAANLGDKDDEGGISVSEALRRDISAQMQASQLDTAAFIDPVLDAIVGLTEASATKAIDAACSSGF